ncbi:MAG TPA: VOC family protein [Acidimicrobiia bacterium]|nr:VOC family protein [Acidimicrobiia bacterium]
MRISATVLNSPDPHALATFYEELLGWTRVADEPDWVKIEPPGGGTGLSFQPESIYVRPTWPAAPGEQQMMLHLDIASSDLDGDVARAQKLGAVLADHQPEPENRVMLDPDGHPFCLFPG